ncbi:DUF6294 family protein [Planomonospora sp. ID67723]|uniref:DUF6294 family protein n=1 Tax=Planomonospora sp. ID67723 TaxID=2738134 RepID=UPI0018C3F1DB|nr:DUF6294 family protein [Planomonospora sp. ID67723]
MLPDVDRRAVSGLKFSAVLPERLAAATDTVAARLADFNGDLGGGGGVPAAGDGHSRGGGGSSGWLRLGVSAVQGLRWSQVAGLGPDRGDIDGVSVDAGVTLTTDGSSVLSTDVRRTGSESNGGDRFEGKPEQLFALRTAFPINRHEAPSSDDGAHSKETSMAKPGLRVLALAVTTTLIGLTTLPGSSYASTASTAASAPNPRNLMLPFEHVEDLFSRPGHAIFGSRLWSAFPVGDCVMAPAFDRDPVTVGIDYTTNELIWHARAWTTHTNSADIWHSTFSFLNSAGQILATVKAPDGPRMPRINTTYEWERVVSFPNRPNFTEVASIRWHAAC